MWKYIPFAFKNSLRNRRRTLLTLLSIGFSLFLLSMLIAIYHLFYHAQGPPQEALRLVTRHRVSLAFDLPEYYVERIGKVAGVQVVCPEDWYGGIYIDNRPEHFFARWATDPEKIFLAYPEFKMPPEQLQAFQKERTAAAIGKPLAEKMHFKLGQKLTFKGDIYPVDIEVTIRAIFEGGVNGSDYQLYFHRKLLQESLPKDDRGRVAMCVLMADSVESAAKIGHEVDEMFRNTSAPTKTESERAFQLSFIAMLGNVKLFLLSICGAVVFTILLVSGNTMAMSVRERIKEIGVLKTLGFTNSKVLTMIVAESVIIALLGGAVGCLLAFGVSVALGKAQLALLPLGLPLPPVVLMISLTISLAIGLLSSLIPAANASRIPITEALRHLG
jgi:putative ABC transport system permease protein